MDARSALVEQARPRVPSRLIYERAEAELVTDQHLDRPRFDSLPDAAEPHA